MDKKRTNDSEPSNKKNKKQNPLTTQPVTTIGQLKGIKDYRVKLSFIGIGETVYPKWDDEYLEKFFSEAIDVRYGTRSIPLDASYLDPKVQEDDPEEEKRLETFFDNAKDVRYN
jgi:hypothetical protein